MNRAQPNHPPAPNSFLRPGVMEVLVCGVAALVYVATLSFGFVYDDVPQILNNPAIHSWRLVPQYFTSHVWAAIYPNSSGNYYRPLFLLWLKLNYALFGTKAAGWHMTNIACHVLATWLVFRIAQLLLDDRPMAFVAALIFGLHPAHVENVAWISGVSDPLMACFLLGSFWAFQRSREPRAASREQPHDEKGGIGLLAARGSKLEAAMSLALFALALLSKETAIVLPVLIFAFVLIFERDDEAGSGLGRRSLAAVQESAPYLLLVLVYGIARYRALGGWSHPTIPIGWTEVVLTWPAVLWFSAFRLGIGAQLYIPNGDRSDYDTDDTFRAMVRVLFAGDVGHYTYAGQLGWHIRPLDDSPTPGSPQGSELVFGAAAGPRFPIGCGGPHAIVVGPEIYGETALQSFFGSNTTGLEALLSGRFEGTADDGSQLRIKLGIGGGLSAHFGAPEFRLVFGIELFDHNTDRDKDGVSDSRDACPDTPGVKTKNPKTNGCPASQGP